MGESGTALPDSFFTSLGGAGVSVVDDDAPDPSEGVPRPSAGLMSFLAWVSTAVRIVEMYSDDKMDKKSARSKIVRPARQT